MNVLHFSIFLIQCLWKIRKNFTNFAQTEQSLKLINFSKITIFFISCNFSLIFCWNILEPSPTSGTQRYFLNPTPHGDWSSNQLLQAVLESMKGKIRQNLKCCFLITCSGPVACQGEHAERSTPKSEKCCRKMKLFPKALFLATTIPKNSKFSQKFPKICVFRPNLPKLMEGF